MKKEKKKDLPPNQNPKTPIPESDAAERLREQQLIRRPLEGYTAQPTHIGEILEDINLPGLESGS